MSDNSANPEFDALKGQFAKVGKEVKKLAGQLGTVSAEVGRQAADTAKRASQEAMAQAADMADTARTQASAASVKAETFTKERPAVALAMAATVGVVAGALLKRR